MKERSSPSALLSVIQNGQAFAHQAVVEYLEELLSGEPHRPLAADDAHGRAPLAERVHEVPVARGAALDRHDAEVLLLHVAAGDDVRDESTWQQTACILCDCNCGIVVHTEDRTLAKIRGDKDHPASQGYTCNKALRLDLYQNGRTGRLTRPLRRRADGQFEEIDWDTAIREVADRLGAVRDAHGGESIFYYGGGGQGNHLGGAYAGATQAAFGIKYRSSALAQEKTGEFWVAARMLGAPHRADVEHCEVAVFIGKNPYQSHGFPRARSVLKDIGKDPNRSMIR